MDANEKVQTLGTYAAVLRRRWLILGTIIPSAILSQFSSPTLLPPSYRS